MEWPAELGRSIINFRDVKTQTIMLSPILAKFQQLGPE